MNRETMDRSPKSITPMNKLWKSRSPKNRAPIGTQADIAKKNKAR